MNVQSQLSHKKFTTIITERNTFKASICHTYFKNHFSNTE